MITQSQYRATYLHHLKMYASYKIFGQRHNAALALLAARKVRKAAKC